MTLKEETKRNQSRSEYTLIKSDLVDGKRKNANTSDYVMVSGNGGISVSGSSTGGGCGRPSEVSREESKPTQHKQKRDETKRDESNRNETGQDGSRMSGAEFGP